MHCTCGLSLTKALLLLLSVSASIICLHYPALLLTLNPYRPLPTVLLHSAAVDGMAHTHIHSYSHCTVPLLCLCVLYFFCPTTPTLSVSLFFDRHVLGSCRSMPQSYFDTVLIVHVQLPYCSCHSHMHVFIVIADTQSNTVYVFDTLSHINCLLLH